MAEGQLLFALPLQSKGGSCIARMAAPPACLLGSGAWPAPRLTHGPLITITHTLPNLAYSSGPPTHTTHTPPLTLTPHPYPQPKPNIPSCLCGCSYHVACARDAGCTFYCNQFLMACKEHAPEFRAEARQQTWCACSPRLPRCCCLLQSRLLLLPAATAAAVSAAGGTWSAGSRRWKWGALTWVARIHQTSMGWESTPTHRPCIFTQSEHMCSREGPESRQGDMRLPWLG